MTEKAWKVFYVLALFLLVFFFALSFYLMGARISELQSSIKDIQGERSVYSRQTKNNSQRVKLYKEELTRFQEDRLSIPANEVDLFSIVQKELTANGVLSRVIDQTGVQKNSKSGETAVKISFEGPYQSFIRTLADWRNLNVALRVKSAVINGYKNDIIRGDIVLEAVVGK